MTYFLTLVLSTANFVLGLADNRLGLGALRAQLVLLRINPSLQVVLANHKTTAPLDFDTLSSVIVDLWIIL